jgi:hypothetical protein
MQEQWRDIKGYEGLYQVSNLGRVKSMKRTTTKGGILKHDIVTGYLRVSLCKNNIRKNYLIHRLVAENFIGYRDSPMQINHKDFNRQNNRPENLEWVTRKENIKHFRTSERAILRDERDNQIKREASKLNLSDILLICKLHDEYKLKIKTLAWLFDIHRNTIMNIFNGKHWSNKYLEV